MTAGETVSHYRIVELLGAGGMGEVYKAEDMRLKRAVALKFLPRALVQDRDAKERLVQEAQAASALDHPNICTIHEIDETPDGRLFLAMAYYPGETLKQRIARGPLDVDEALAIIAQVVRAVVAAHEAGIIHRDIKPANIMLARRGASGLRSQANEAGQTAEGTTAAPPRLEDRRLERRLPAAGDPDVKLLDFGVAKLSGRTAITRTGTTLGTVAYMAPEQITGQAATERSDVWALGVVLYEMVAGRLPFAGEHEVAVLNAIANDTPRRLRDVRADVPAMAESIVGKALQKDVRARYPSASEFLQDVEALRSSRSTTTSTQPIGATPLAFSRRRFMIVGGLALVTIASLGGWFAYRTARVRWARQEALPQIKQLVQQEQYAPAFRALRRVEPYLADDPEFINVKTEFLFPLSVRTEPSDADLYIKGYTEVDAEWEYLGRSPLETRGPLGYFRWRVTKPGFAPFEGANSASLGDMTFVLAPEGTVPQGMVRIPDNTVQVANGGAIRLPEFFIDRYEVTNREFKRFVDGGGYRKQEYWKESFVQDGRVLSWEQAMAAFRDATGRPGPATWELGTYPDGQDDYPVRGVSWYEAVAFARFSGKSLPTVHHWRAAAAAGIYSDILELSNFGGKGPARIGTHHGLGPYGTYDMAGNVKEWCWNEVRARRYILGGAWNEPNYQFRGDDARPPFDRSPNNGFRCIKPTDPSAVPTPIWHPIERLTRDYSREKPVPDDVFRVYQSLYSYDRTDLKPVVESVDEDSPAWRIERISYGAAYGNERIVAYLFLPRNARPPYQTVVYFPHSGGQYLRSFERGEMSYLGFIVKAGRALLFPMYKGTYERRLTSPPTGPSGRRDLTIQQMKDLRRSLDYLETRKDIDRDRLAFFGVSLGGRLGSIALGVEPRFKAAVLWSGGFPLTSRLPEVDEINFAPRVTTPILMANGRDDFTFPIEDSQLPMFRLLGTREADKHHLVYEGGHVFPFSRIVKDTLEWLDRYLGTPQ